MNHPYWLTLTIAVGLIALALTAFLGCLTGWAWTKWTHAQQQLKWDIDTHFTPDDALEVEHQKLLAEHGDD